MVSVSSLEVVFCKSDECFSGAVLLTCDGAFGRLVMIGGSFH